MNFLIPKRKAFISYHGTDKVAVDAFISRWAHREGVFIPKVIGVYGQDLINSDDADYIMGRLRRDYLGDSTVTILLLGHCTHSRRYIDWEVKASLRQGDFYTPNGLIGILLPGYTPVHLPDRFQANWNRELKSVTPSACRKPSPRTQAEWPTKNRPPLG
jgi:hypothetical protein